MEYRGGGLQAAAARKGTAPTTRHGRGVEAHPGFGFRLVLLVLARSLARPPSLPCLRRSSAEVAAPPLPSRSRSTPWLLFCNFCLFTTALDLCQWESEVINTKFEFQRYPPKLFRTRFLWARLEKKKRFKLLEKARKKQIWGRCWANIGWRKT